MTIKRIHLIWPVLITVFAFYTVLAPLAFAELEFLLAFWLVNGAHFTGSLPADATGEALQENLNNGASFVCSAVADGDLIEEEPSENLSMFLVQKILTLAGVEIRELAGEGLLCTALKTCEVSTDVEVFPDELPWLFYIDLHVETGELEELYVGLAGLEGTKLPSDEIKCLVLGLPVEELCTTSANEAEMEVLNVTGGVEAMGAESPEGTCGGTTGVKFGEALPGNLLTSSEGTISISSE